MPDIAKCFEILNIPPNTSYEEANAAYRELAIILHPDKYMHNERLRIRAAEKFKQLLNAWNELEAYYKNPGLYEQYDQANYENQQRENQQRKRAEAERNAEVERRAQAELKAQEERRAEAECKVQAEQKRRVQLQYNQHVCPYCAHVNTVERSKTIESLKCWYCGYFWSKEYENKLKRKTKYKFIRLMVIYVLFYVGLLKVMGGLAIILMFFTAPFLFIFTLTWHVDIFNGWRTS